MMKSVYLFFVLLFCQAMVAFSQPYFHLDSTFSMEGYAIPIYPANDIGYDLVIQPGDGKILVVGKHNSNCLVSRFLPDGSPDDSFGFSGSVTFKFGTLSSVLNSIALQADGKIVVAGGTDQGFPPAIGLARLLPDGSFDPSFGTSGKASVMLGPSWCRPASDVLIQPDGRIIVCASAVPDSLVFSDYATAVLRFKSNGVLDSTFSDDGKLILNLLRPGDENGQSLALQSDGKIILAGAIETTTTDGWTLTRLLPNGSLDPSFALSGSNKYFGAQVQEIALQPDGKIVAVGSTGGGQAIAARFSANGAYDPSFGSGGIYLAPSHTRANGLALQPDGKVVMAGFSRTGSVLVGFTYRFYVGRLLKNGLPDNTFTATGAVSWLINGDDEELHKVVLQPNGKILCAGYYQNNLSQQDMVLLRLTNGELIEPPTVHFTAINPSGCAPLTVQFNSTASADATSWNWSFPGGIPATSTEQNPSVKYSTAGTYAVTLSAGNAGGSNTISKNNFVVVKMPPSTDFAFSLNGQTASFSNTSTNADSYMWNFGDGSTGSTEATPTHTYATPGTYTVTLTALNNCGATILQKILGISSTDEPAWASSLHLFPNPTSGVLQVEMSDAPSGAVSFDLFDATGRLLHQTWVATGGSVLSQTFDLRDLPPALYALRIQAGGQTVVRTVVRE